MHWKANTFHENEKGNGGIDGRKGEEEERRGNEMKRERGEKRGNEERRKREENDGREEKRCTPKYDAEME